jgi:hypothetical protein
MCTLPQGAMNSAAHMVNAMNNVLKNCISETTMPFLDDIPMKGCPVELKDESKNEDGCRKFVVDHIADCEKVLRGLEDANLTFSGSLHLGNWRFWWWDICVDRSVVNLRQRRLTQSKL